MKNYYVSECHKLEVRGDKIVDSITREQDVLFNTWCQRGLCKVENGDPINLYEDAITAISEYHYPSVTYHTQIQSISKSLAASIYLSQDVGIMDAEVSSKDAGLVLRKIIHK